MVATPTIPETALRPFYLLAVKDPARRRVYEQALATMKTNWKAFKSLKEASQQAYHTPCSALLIDMPLIVRASSAEKTASEDVMQGIPNALLNIFGVTKEIRLLPRGKCAIETHSLAQFIEHCDTLPPKLFFPRNRVNLNLNILLCDNADFDGAERTACMDLSLGGCFVFSARTDVSQGSAVWLRFVGLNDQTPVLGTVCWKREWGRSHKIPGMGICFETISDDLRVEMNDLLNSLNPPRSPGAETAEPNS